VRRLPRVIFATPPDSTKPNPELENRGAVALREAKQLKASYAGIRIIRYRQRSLTVRLNAERGTGKTLEVPVVSDGGYRPVNYRWSCG
jgi:hypothetical protein